VASKTRWARWLFTSVIGFTASTFYACFPDMPLVAISGAQRLAIGSANFAGTVLHGPSLGSSEWQGCQTSRKIASARLACKELNSKAAVTRWRVVRRLAGDLQPISKFPTKYYLW
jgi:hypothetical protein